MSYRQFFKTLPLQARPVSADWTLMFRVAANIKIAWETEGHQQSETVLHAKTLILYRAQVRPYMEYCSQLWAGALQFQFQPLATFTAYNVEPFDSLWTQCSVKGLTLWLCVETSPRCAFSTAFIMGSVLKNCLTCYLPPNFLATLVRYKLKIIHTIWILTLHYCAVS